MHSEDSKPPTREYCVPGPDLTRKLDTCTHADCSREAGLGVRDAGPGLVEMATWTAGEECEAVGFEPQAAFAEMRAPRRAKSISRLLDTVPNIPPGMTNRFYPMFPLALLRTLV